MHVRSDHAYVNFYSQFKGVFILSPLGKEMSSWMWQTTKL